MSAARPPEGSRPVGARADESPPDKRPDVAAAPPSTPLAAARAGIWPWLLLALLVLLVDQWTKSWILSNYQYADRTVVTGFFNIVRAHNTGAAFSFLADAAGWQRWFFTAVGVGAAGFIVWMLRSHAGQRLFSFAMAAILGGALGNVIDRLMHGYVVDFLDFHAAGRHFPAFNVADGAITVGAVCLILDELRRARRKA